MSFRRFFLVAFTSAIGCAPPGAAGGTGGPDRAGLITADEAAGFNPEGRTAYDLVSRLRPKWLRPNGVQSLNAQSDSSEFAMVVVDNQPMGRIQALRDVQAYQVVDIHYYDPSLAQGKYGARGAAGVIEVRTKTSRR